MYTHKSGHICHSQYTSVNSPLHTLKFTSVTAYSLCPSSDVTFQVLSSMSDTFCVSIFKLALCLFCISVCFHVLFL